MDRICWWVWGRLVLGLLLGGVFGLFGLGGGWCRRICGLWVFGVLFFCVWGFFCVGLWVLFGWCWGRVCRLGFGGIGVVFWFCPSMRWIGVRRLCCFVCRGGLLCVFVIPHSGVLYSTLTFYSLTYMM